MKKYEGMFIIRPDLSEDEKKTLFNQISEAVTKNNGSVSGASVWSEKRKLFFPIKRYREGVYYLLNFTAVPTSIKDINRAYRLNENILRVLFSRLE
ncbi:MAG: 30S ribosomal protein S6 [Candidatus Omnitrophica bacterium]|nr:30S ribosomal protein S6 [Candidatus Omnitrophota bacterium]